MDSEPRAGRPRIPRNAILVYELALMDLIKTENDGGMDGLDWAQPRQLPFDRPFGVGRQITVAVYGACCVALQSSRGVEKVLII